jgi:carbon storage regulator CsrA
MLVLTRKQKECIKIGDSITITILRVQGQAVRVGIEAPREVRVVRGELASKEEPAAVAAEADEEPTVIEFRFSPEPVEEGAADHRPMPRGPLASLMATLNTTGYVAEAVSK